MGNVELVRRYVQAWVDRDADAILASFGEGGTYEDPATGGPISAEALRAYVEGLWSAFPDLTFDEESLGEIAPDLVASQWVMRGTNYGGFGGLPPTGLPVELRGADIIELYDGAIRSVTGYFDAGQVPRQLGLDVIVQPREIGPFKLGIVGGVQTGKTMEPGAFAITCMHARNDQAIEQIKEASAAAWFDMLQMDGFIGGIGAVIGNRMMTVSAWESPDDLGQQLRESAAHNGAMTAFYDGSVAKHGFTSVWTKHRISSVTVLCDSCGSMNRDAEGQRTCSCGATLPDAVPFW
jgi:steroid delta-isomerase-like uncharacterized protein